MGATLAEKIFAKAVGKASVKPGDVLEPKVGLAMSHENAALVINQFKEIFSGTGLELRVWDPSRIAIIFDHRVPAESAKTANNQKKIREFVAAQGITKFHEIRGDEGGICHQILPENGYVRPGMIVVGTDSHTTTHGALGAVAWGIGATEMAAVWALGRVLNVEVPPTMKIVIEGELPAMVAPKDIILYLIGKLTAQGGNFRVLEFHGSAAKAMPTSGRLVLSNMSVEAGATSGLFPPDEETLRYLREDAGVTDEIEMIAPDADAEYEKTITIDVSKLEPQVACPHTVDNVKPVSQVEGRKIDQIVIGSCTNGRLDDIAIAAKILRGKKIARNMRMLVFPASGRIYRQALDAGYIKDLMDAGAVVMNSGCGCCLGVHQGALADGEVALSTTNRNFKGRMGNPNAEVYLCSPATAAVSALTGVITDPRKGAY
ncbi:MAG: 3-isopropylmalate dehydratase large subunit [Candidatus Sumerlaeaceae bacterium]|jgi:3-isopropylmalate/(R)-2-methylmalate dehydratase large subunit